MKKLNTKSKVAALAAMTVIGIATTWTLNSRISARPMPLCNTCGAIFSFGMLGITAEQTARLSVVNTKKCLQAGTCTPSQVELKFVNSDGNAITNADGQPRQSTVTLASGQSAFLDLNGGSLVSAGRVQFRAQVPSCVDCGNSKGTVLATLEIFDNATGKTTLVMPDYPAISSHGDDDH